MLKNNSSDAWIHELLQPLQNEEIEYKHQYNMLAEFQRRHHLLESLYADVYSKIAAMENKL